MPEIRFCFPQGGSALVLSCLLYQCPCSGWVCLLKVWQPQLLWVSGLCRVWPHSPLAVSLFQVCWGGPRGGVGCGRPSPAFPVDANPSVSLPCSVGLMAPRRVCGPDGQAPEPRPPPPPPRNSVQGVQHLERQCLAFPSPWMGKCPCSCERCSSLPHPQPCPLVSALRAQQVSLRRRVSGKWIIDESKSQSHNRMQQTRAPVNTKWPRYYYRCCENTNERTN